MIKYKKILASIIIGFLLLNQASFVALAEGEITPAPEQPQPTASIQWPQRADIPEKADKPEKADVPDALRVTPTPAPEQNAVNNIVVPDNASPTPAPTTGGNTGTDTAIGTGDANNNSNISNLGNTNVAAGGSCSTNCGSGSGVSVDNTGNGAGSDNNGSASVVNNDNTNQGNSAVIVNTSNQSATTGNNDNSKNTGGDSTINTGDANVTGTILTSANTNVDGVGVSEFNIIDDHKGDFVLDFGANCIVGCGGNTNVANTGNGADSTNNAAANNVNNSTTNQANNGDVTNNLTFNADSGHNEASKNTGGNSSITTGDANVAANLMTFLNNNIAGGVMFGVVNIFGNLVGDIILPEDVFNQFACGACNGSTNVANTGNGADSTNLAGATSETNNNVFQSNDANIQNNLVFDAQTGKNEVDKNTDGNNSITTGNVLVDANILNVANLNMIGGNMWLVIVNEAGNWVGKLFGAPQGSTLAGSDGMNFAMDPNGVINVTNAGNGADSNNTGVSNTTNNNTLNQTNNANVVNNVNLSANTGGNEASKNTGGNSSIVTGDAQAIANIVNFVNNNIAGGKLLVTFVNVFGTWKGDFLTPGAHKDSSPVVAQGGTNNTNANTNNSGNNNVQTTTTSGGVSAKGGSKVVATGFSGNSASVSSGGNVNVKVAGISNTDVLSALIKNKSAQKEATINLAWILAALPLAGIALFARKKYLNKTSA